MDVCETAHEKKLTGTSDVKFIKIILEREEYHLKVHRKNNVLMENMTSYIEIVK